MSFRVTEQPDGATVHLDGEIDLERSPEARTLLLGLIGKGKAVRVDLHEVRYMDSSGLASLVEAHQKARAAKLDFSLVRVNQAVMKVLSMARLDQVFAIER